MNQVSSKKPLSDIKNINQRHYTCLTSKNNLDNTLLDDIKSFCKQRSVIEKEYAQALQKLSNGFLSKKEYIPLAKQSQENIELNDAKTLWHIWRNILLETQFNSAARQRLSESHLRLSTELKPLKVQRLTTSKQIFDQIKSLQSDLAACIQEMCKSHKVYHEEEKQSHEIRYKSYAAEEKIRRKSTNLFNSMATLHKNHEKLASHLEACETRSTSARNEYLFQLAAINAHLKHYYTKDIPELTKILDGDFYERVREIFTIICQNEAEIAAIHHKKFEKLSIGSTQISRSIEWQVLAKEMQVNDCDILQYAFQSCENDQIKSLCPPHAKDEETLEQIGRKLARRLVIRQRRIKAYREEMKALQLDNHSCGKTSITPESNQSISPDYESNEQMLSFNSEYVEHKVEELLFAIRREEIEQCKVDACLQLMRQSPANVDILIRDAEQAAEAAEKAAIVERERLKQKAIYEQQHGISASLEDSPPSRDNTAEMYSYFTNLPDPEHGSFMKSRKRSDIHKINSVPENKGFQQDSSETTDLISFDPYFAVEKNSNSLSSNYTGFYNESGGSSNGDENNSTRSANYLNVDSSLARSSSSVESNVSKQARISTQMKTDSNNSDDRNMEAVWSENGRLRKATVIKEYRAKNNNESDLVKFENVVLLEKFSNEQLSQREITWIKVRSLIDGSEGLVPLKCLELQKSPAPLPPASNSITQLILDQDVSISSEVPHNQRFSSPPKQPAPKLSPNFVENLISREGDFVRTLVDYTGTDPDELTFVSESVIRVTSNSRSTNASHFSADFRRSNGLGPTGVISGIYSSGIDDGWWEGDLILALDRPGLYSVRRGVFASMLVEPLPDNLIERWQDLWEQSQLAIAEMNKRRNNIENNGAASWKQNAVYYKTNEYDYNKNTQDFPLYSNATYKNKGNSQRKARFDDEGRRSSMSVKSSEITCSECYIRGGGTRTARSSSESNRTRQVNNVNDCRKCPSKNNDRKLQVNMPSKRRINESKIALKKSTPQARAAIPAAKVPCCPSEPEYEEIKLELEAEIAEL